MAARFFLGLVESIIGPVFVIVTSNWWTRPEQAFRTAFWLGGTPVRVPFSVGFAMPYDILLYLDWKLLRWHSLLRPWVE